MLGVRIDPDIYETFWRFAAERQAIYERRLAGAAPPWTDDPILRSYRFTNVYRASDRVSQYLIRNVIAGSETLDDLVLRVLVFKFFNKIETWQLLVDALGDPTCATFDVGAAEAVLSDARARGLSIYSPAYIVAPVPTHPSPKHVGHLRLAASAVENGLGATLATSRYLAELFEELIRMPGVGRFLAYQLSIDLNYSDLIDLDETDFVVPGPGALDGISKLAPGTSPRLASDLIKHLTSAQAEAFATYGPSFGGLFGRPLQLIDVQNLLCELSKYTRVSHPDVPGSAGRTRIKQSFRPLGVLPPPMFPRKWQLAVRSKAANTADESLCARQEELFGDVGVLA